MSVLAVIPAKGRSQRLPGKNKKELGGKPLVEWTISAALRAHSVNEIIVSTDDDDIRQVADKLSINHCPQSKHEHAVDAVLEAIQHTGYHDYTLMLQPTSPFRKPSQIDEALDLLANGRPVISIKSPKGKPYRTDIFAGQPGYPAVFSNGAIYATSTRDLLRWNKFHAGCITPYAMDDITGWEIDTEFDWQVAELIVDKGLHK